MDKNQFEILRHTEYKIIDDGRHAPLGSNPVFVSMMYIDHETNDGNDFVSGYVCNDSQPGGEDIPESSVPLVDIIGEKETI